MVAKSLGRKALPIQGRPRMWSVFEYEADRVAHVEGESATVALQEILRGDKDMANRRKFFPTVIAAALMAIFLPLIASAQGGYDTWNRGGRDRDNYGRFDSRGLRDATRRLDDHSRDFQRHLDSALDRSRYDGTRREDRINEIAREFRFAAADLRSSVADWRNIHRSTDEARRVLQIGSRIDQFISRQRLDFRAAADWAQIRQDLRVIADIYNIGYGGGGGWRR